ncbi:MAG: type II/IV secretion system protein [Candidatus Moranbacteria bacterium]|nr:type II/IV secretion system protein [Candidatus Moranbacteria bacterium]
MQNNTQNNTQTEGLKKKTLESSVQVSKEIIVVIPEEVARTHSMVAFGREGSILRVAMKDTEDIAALNVLRFIAQNQNLSIETYEASEKVIKDMLGQYSSAEKAVSAVVKSFKEEEEEDIGKKRKESATEIYDNIQDAPVAKLVQVIVRHAIEGRASDIHIEPIEGKYRVRYRVDGILHTSLTLPLDVGTAVVSRIKILSNLKIDEKRKPQDGRFRSTETGRSVDFRVSTLPVVEGEKAVLRVLEKDSGLGKVDKLGLMGHNKEILEQKIREPYGIILMTGPTGSGKSTSLYAFLQILNQEERNIITLEDPVEYFIDGVNQSQIKPEIGYTFANGLRSILRQDPNVIMVGEIRDGETAELAIHAALTGHLVFTTLHTNDAIGAIPRLVDMGIEPFLLSAALREVAAQRLVRRICESCKKEAKIPTAIREKMEKELKEISEKDIEKYNIDLSQGVKFFEGAGCDKCGKTGYKGRVAIYEVVGMDDKIHSAIVDHDARRDVIEKRAKENGMLSLKQDGLLKVLLGLTTVAELERVTEGSRTIGGKIDDVSNEDEEREEDGTQKIDEQETEEPYPDLMRV